MRFLQSDRTVADIEPNHILDWMRDIHAALSDAAEKHGTTPRELACTLLLGIVGCNAAAFAQIGDGAIVISDGAVCRPVFWPQSGEYQNFTFFLTDPKFERNVQCELLAQTVPELALFSDGLQTLALKYDTRTAHQPFFMPLFSALRKSEDPQELANPMREFLGSAPVNDRTDDDKTLVLATQLTEEMALDIGRRAAGQVAHTTTENVDENL